MTCGKVARYQMRMSYHDQFDEMQNRILHLQRAIEVISSHNIKLKLDLDAAREAITRLNNDERQPADEPIAQPSSIARHPAGRFSWIGEPLLKLKELKSNGYNIATAKEIIEDEFSCNLTLPAIRVQWYKIK